MRLWLLKGTASTDRPQLTSGEIRAGWNQRPLNQGRRCSTGANGRTVRRFPAVEQDGVAGARQELAP